MLPVRVSIKSWTMRLASSFPFAVFFLLIIFSVAAQKNFAQENKLTASSETGNEFDIKQGSFLLPQALPKWQYSHAFSIYYVVPPKDWTLDMVKAPFLNCSCKLALPKAFNVQASLSTIFVSNRI